MLTRALDTRVAEAAQLRKALEVAKREAARMHTEMDELRQAGGGYESQLRVAESMMRQSQDSVRRRSFSVIGLGPMQSVTDRLWLCPGQQVSCFGTVSHRPRGMC